VTPARPRVGPAGRPDVWPRSAGSFAEACVEGPVGQNVHLLRRGFVRLAFGSCCAPAADLVLEPVRFTSPHSARFTDDPLHSRDERNPPSACSCTFRSVGLRCGSAARCASPTSRQVPCHHRPSLRPRCPDAGITGPTSSSASPARPIETSATPRDGAPGPSPSRYPSSNSIRPARPPRTPRSGAAVGCSGSLRRLAELVAETSWALEPEADGTKVRSGRRRGRAARTKRRTDVGPGPPTTRLRALHPESAATAPGDFVTTFVTRAAPELPLSDEAPLRVLRTFGGDLRAGRRRCHAAARTPPRPRA